MNIDPETGWREWVQWAVLIPACIVFAVIYAACWLLGVEDRDDLNRGPYP